MENYFKSFQATGSHRFEPGRMAIKALLLLCLFHIVALQQAQAQWTTKSDGEIYFNGGYAGLGTTDPLRFFHLRYNNTAIASALLYLEQDGTGDSWMNFGLTGGRHYAIGIDNSDGDRFKIGTHSTAARGVADGTLLSIAPSGQVCLGTTSAPSAYRLAVNGNVIANSVRVQLYTEWADYVFSRKYRLMPFPELEAYIQANHHLPNMPKASKVAAEGLDIGDMQRLITEKVEELTLYVLQLNKRIEQLEQENAQLKRKQQ